ncbi:hypothetical protein ACFLY2_02645 [Patescibacteria group bacterium]
MNYEDVREQIVEKIEKLKQVNEIGQMDLKGQTHRSAPTENNVGVNLCVHPINEQNIHPKIEQQNDYELKLKTNLKYKDKIWFYSSDYSDILGMDNISGFM